MEEKPASVTSRFFKIMLPGFHEKLNLPQHLCKNLTGKSLPDQAILETRLGKWRIRVCRSRDGLIWFQNGWPDFAHHHALNVGDLVVFEPTAGSFLFKTVVFDTSACEKEFLQHPLEDPPKPITSKPETEPDAIDFDCKDPFFIMRMSPYHAKETPAVRVPMRFMRNNNIENVKSMIVRDPRGREWKVRMSFYAGRKSPCHCRWAKGWHAFYKGNKLKDGDVCIFKFMRSEYHQSSRVIFDVQIKPKAEFLEL